MGYDKSVDSSALNADLTSIANAIRSKTGGSAALAFPNGMINAINDIPTGSGTDVAEITTINSRNAAIFTYADCTKIKKIVYFYNYNWHIDTPAGTYFTNNEVLSGGPTITIVSATTINLKYNNTGITPRCAVGIISDP